jgi:hypothetical protein
MRSLGATGDTCGARKESHEKQETPSDTREDRKKYKESRKLIRRAKGISNLTGYYSRLRIVV